LIASDWINKVLEKAVPIYPQLPKRNGRQNKYSGTMMNKGLQQSAPIVPNVPIKEVISDNLSGQTDSDFEKVRGWLFQTGEPEEDHYLVLDKCKSDTNLIAYYLGLTNNDKE
jgi:hypothetical protein